jgi:hypothetical protein
VGHERSLFEVRSEALATLEFDVVAVFAGGGKCAIEPSSSEAREEPQNSGSGEVAGVLLADDSSELEALLLIVWVLGKVDVGDDTKPSILAVIGSQVMETEARVSSAACFNGWGLSTVL